MWKGWSVQGTPHRTGRWSGREKERGEEKETETEKQPKIQIRLLSKFVRLLLPPFIQCIGVPRRKPRVKQARCLRELKDRSVSRGTLSADTTVDSGPFETESCPLPRPVLSAADLRGNSCILRGQSIGHVGIKGKGACAACRDCGRMSGEQRLSQLPSDCGRKMGEQRLPESPLCR